MLVRYRMTVALHIMPNLTFILITNTCTLLLKRYETSLG